jgi:hypothetical protein
MKRSAWSALKILFALACTIGFGFAAISSGGQASSNAHAVAVDTAGVHTDPVYVHASDTVKWTSGGASFTISFQNSPWGADSAAYSSSGHPPTVTSPPFPACTSGKACDYKYTLEINGKVFDPHVIVVPG